MNKKRCIGILLLFVQIVFSMNHPFVTSKALTNIECKDFFSDPATRTDINEYSKRKIYKFGFYSTNTGVTDIYNFKATYIHASPIMEDDEGILFTSNFIAELQDPSKDWGLIKRNSSGTYEGGILRGDGDNGLFWYYQILKGENAGKIYRVFYKVDGRTNHILYGGTGWSTYAIPNTKKFFSKSKNSSGNPCVYLIDLTDPENPQQESIEIEKPTIDPYITANHFNLDCDILGSNSINGLGTSTNSTIRIGCEAIKAERVVLGRKVTERFPGYLEITNWNDPSNRKAVLHTIANQRKFKMEYDPTYGTYTPTKEDNESKVYPASYQYLNHALINPTDNNFLIFSDEHCWKTDTINKGTRSQLIRHWKKLANRIHKFKIGTNDYYTGNLRTDAWYEEWGSEVISHHSFSHDGKSIFACRMSGGGKGNGSADMRVQSLIRIPINDDGTADAPQNLFEGISNSEFQGWHEKFTNHQDNSHDGNYCLFDREVAYKKDINDVDQPHWMWEVGLVHNIPLDENNVPLDEKEPSQILAQFSMKELYTSPNVYHGTFHPHPNFSLTDNFSVFAYQAEHPDDASRKISAVGVVALKKTGQEANHALPISAPLDLVSVPANTSKNVYQPLLVSATEITQDEYADVMNVSTFDYFDHHLANGPATGINWFDAILYCNKRSKMEGLDTVYSYSGPIYMYSAPSVNGFYTDKSKNGYRLPTFDEWHWLFNGTHNGSMSNYAVYNTDKPSNIASKLPNPQGLYDMCGNVWEWIDHTTWSGQGMLLGGAWDRSFQQLWGDRTHPFDKIERSFLSTSKYRGFRVVRNAPPLLDEDFESGSSDWDFYIDNSASASMYVGTIDPAVSRTQGLITAISSDGSENWHIHAKYKDLKIEKGERYRVTLDAKTQQYQNRKIGLWVGGNASKSWATYAYQEFTIDDSMQEYSFEFEMSEDSDTEGEFSINMGDFGDWKWYDIYIDNVVIEKL